MPEHDDTYVPPRRRGHATKEWDREQVSKANERNDDLIDVVVQQANDRADDAHKSAQNAWRVTRWMGLLLGVSVLGNILLVALVFNRTAAFEFMGIKGSAGPSPTIEAPGAP